MRFEINVFRKISLFALVLMLSVVYGSLAAQKRVSGQRYMEEYKKYLNAACPIKGDSIRHLVYFGRDRQLIRDHPLLSHPLFKGAQIMYPWRQLEPEKGRYDFSQVKEDYEYLKKFGKTLFIQLQDATFSTKYEGVPLYLLSKEYNGGAVPQYDDNNKPAGWVAKRWNKKVRERFQLLFEALGKN